MDSYHDYRVAQVAHLRNIKDIAQTLELAAKQLRKALTAGSTSLRVSHLEAAVVQVVGIEREVNQLLEVYSGHLAG